jgi:glycosyltransferase involved in cell wall biosynthesis
MYDILFDFSSSPAGGGLRRLEAYAEYFSTSSLKTHFFVHEEAKNKDVIQRLVPTSLVGKTAISKITLNKKYLAPFRNRAKWFFSYGIPIKENFAEKNWLHISNALPFAVFDVSLGADLFLRMFTLRQQFKKYIYSIDIVSAESNFALKQYQALTGIKVDYCLLRNGVDYSKKNLNKFGKEPFAIAIGTYSYKRIDLTYNLFQALKKDLRLDKLLIVGDSKKIPKFIKSANDVEVQDYLTEDDLHFRLKKATYFISTSEVENSSYAVLEGLQLTKKAILSDIPSHREMLRANFSGTLKCNDLDILVVNYKDVSLEVMSSWVSEIELMLSKMRLI